MHQIVFADERIIAEESAIIAQKRSNQDFLLVARVQAIQFIAVEEEKYARLTLIFIFVVQITGARQQV